MLVIRYDWRNNSVLFVHNLDEKPREVTFAAGLPGETGKLLVNLLTEDHSQADERGKHTLLLEGYGYRWYRVGGLDYLLKRSEIDTDATAQDKSSCRERSGRGLRPSLPRRSSVPCTCSPPRSRKVDSRISRPDADRTGGDRNGFAAEIQRHDHGARPRLHGDRAGYRLRQRPVDRRPSRAAATSSGARSMPCRG